MTAGSAKGPVRMDCGLGHACPFCPQEEMCVLDKPRHNKALIERRLAAIGQIIVVLANKGGVGKSTVAANLAAGLARRGFKVGVADADIHGPNQSRFFGFAGERVRLGDNGLATRDFHHRTIDNGVKVGSLAFLLRDDDTPVVWRDAYKHDFIHHLIGSFDWGPLDHLIVDMPPGTGNELITLCDMLEGSAVSALLVTTPQAVALMDSMKAVRFCRERGVPLIGAVENMAGVVCPHCAGAFHVFPDDGLAATLRNEDVEILAQIPLAPELASCSDGGVPILVSNPDCAVAGAFDPLVTACVAFARENFAAATARALDGALRENLSSDRFAGALAGLDDPVRAEIGEAVSALLSGESARLHGGGRQ